MAKKQKKAKEQKKAKAVVPKPREVPAPLSPGMKALAQAGKDEMANLVKQNPISPEMRGKPITGTEIRALSKSVCEMADDGFETLYDNVEMLVEMYPERQQFPLALRCRNEGNVKIARQALRNGLVDLE